MTSLPAPLRRARKFYYAQCEAARQAHLALVTELRANGPTPEAERLLAASRSADISASCANGNYKREKQRLGLSVIIDRELLATIPVRFYQEGAA